MIASVSYWEFAVAADEVDTEFGESAVKFLGVAASAIVSSADIGKTSGKIAGGGCSLDDNDDVSGGGAVLVVC